MTVITYPCESLLVFSLGTQLFFVVSHFWCELLEDGLDEKPDGKGGLSKGRGPGEESLMGFKDSFTEVIFHLWNNYILMTVLSRMCMGQGSSVALPTGSVSSSETSTCMRGRTGARMLERTDELAGLHCFGRKSRWGSSRPSSHERIPGRVGLA